MAHNNQMKERSSDFSQMRRISPMSSALTGMKKTKKIKKKKSFQ
jgi:hypothetical protein